MRKLSLFTSAVFVLLAMAGCLKDKRFDNNEMGIVTTDIPGVALTQSASSPIVVGITGQAAPIVVDGPLITLETSYAPTADVTVTLAYDPTLVTAAGLTPLPAGTFSTSTLTPVIAAGSKGITNLKITVSGTNVLDPNLRYGIGFKITAVSAGYQIAANLKTVVFGFAIKNKYDGKYSLTFSNYHPSANPGYTGDVVEVEMHTTGPNSVKIYMPQPGFKGFYNPAILGGGLSAFADQEPEYTINPTTNVVTVQNTAAAAVTFYAMAAGFSSRYDPATKKIYAKFGYNNPGGVFDPAITREWTQEFTYLGPR